MDEARLIHAEGYLAAGFVDDATPQDPSRISAAWSIPHGCDASYYVVVNADDPADRATSTQLRPAPGQGYESLPGLRLCRDALSESGRALLEAAAARGPVIEISGLAHATGGSPYSVHEVIRWMVHEADDNATWVFAIVVETLQSLRRSFGREAFQSLGGEVMLGEYGGISVDVTLTPILLCPARLPRTIRDEAMVLLDGVQRRRLLRTVAFLEHEPTASGGHDG